MPSQTEFEANEKKCFLTEDSRAQRGTKLMPIS